MNDPNDSFELREEIINKEIVNSPNYNGKAEQYSSFRYIK
jgi:hypothetical protein